MPNFNPKSVIALLQNHFGSTSETEFSDGDQNEAAHLIQYIQTRLSIDSSDDWIENEIEIEETLVMADCESLQGDDDSVADTEEYGSELEENIENESDLESQDESQMESCIQTRSEATYSPATDKENTDLYTLIPEKNKRRHRISETNLEKAYKIYIQPKTIRRSFSSMKSKLPGIIGDEEEYEILKRHFLFLQNI